MDGEHDDDQVDDQGVFGEHELTSDVDDVERRLAEPPPGWRRDGWAALGQAVAVVLIVFGLTMVGLFALLLISLNSWGSNK